MRRRLPPLEQIEAFIEGARARSFREAAERMALSPAAFSRRIQAFSGSIGLRLFERAANGVRLTEAGRRCLDELEPAYVELRRAAAFIVDEESHDRRVRVSLSLSLAVNWLIPRLDGFEASHPDIDFSLKTDRTASALRDGAADLAIIFSDIDVTGLEARPLLRVDALPVASPALAAEIIAAGGGLDGRRLLTVAFPPDMWAWWMTATGVHFPPGPTVSFEFTQAMYAAATEGLGVALGSAPTVLPHLRAGRLAPLGLPAALLDGYYRLAARPGGRRRRSVATVSDWLLAQARATPGLQDSAST